MQTVPGQPILLSRMYQALCPDIFTRKSGLSREAQPPGIYRCDT